MWYYNNSGNKLKVDDKMFEIKEILTILSHQKEKKKPIDMFKLKKNIFYCYYDSENEIKLTGYLFISCK